MASPPPSSGSRLDSAMIRVPGARGLVLSIEMAQHEEDMIEVTVA
jgi:hypothetical protein